MANILIIDDQKWVTFHYCHMGLASNLPKHPLFSGVKGNQPYPPLHSTLGSGQFQGRSFWLKVIVLFGDMHNDNMSVKFQTDKFKFQRIAYGTERY